MQHLAGSISRAKPDEDKGLETVGFPYPKEAHGVFVTAHWFAHSFMFRNSVLLWITEWGIWPTSENWHLYYKLRQAAGDFRLLQEAPGHLFLEHETEDLASFTQTAMLNGWGGYILTQADYVNAFFSHDEYIDFFARFPENLEEVRKFWASRSAKTS
jgi:hypothetical protein